MKQSLFENISILVGTVAILIITPLTGQAEVSFLGVAAGDASSHDATVWTRAKDEANPQPTAVDVQISTDSLQQVFENYQPMKERGLINVPSDPRTHGTRQLFLDQQWGRHAIFINTDCRSQPPRKPLTGTGVTALSCLRFGPVSRFYT
jgi:hypothetical protein